MMTQSRLGSMLSVLAQRSFVELTRLFGASHLAEGQDPPSGSGSDITAEVPLIMSNTLRLRFELIIRFFIRISICRHIVQHMSSS